MEEAWAFVVNDLEIEFIEIHVSKAIFDVVEAGATRRVVLWKFLCFDEFVREIWNLVQIIRFRNINKVMVEFNSHSWFLPKHDVRVGLCKSDGSEDANGCLLHLYLSMLFYIKYYLIIKDTDTF